MTESNTVSSLITIVLCSSNHTHPPISNVTKIIDQILDPTNYVLHFITPDELITAPWKEYTTILFVDIIESSQVHLILAHLHTYQEKFNGIIVALDTSFYILYKEKYGIVCSDECGEYNSFVSVSCVQSGKTILCKENLLSLIANFQLMLSKNLRIFRYIFEQSGIKTLSEPSPVPKMTFGYLLMRNHDGKENLVKSIETQYQSKSFAETDLKIGFISTDKSSTNALEPSHHFLPIFLRKIPPTNLFDYEMYLKHLKTKSLGENIIYTEVTTSTIDVLNSKLVFSVPIKYSLLVICSIQTKGKGRGSNQWVSPKGCLMFSQLLTINAHSFIGRHITLIQHIVSVAIVHGIRSLDAYKHLDIRLKWPNDIYFDTEHKLGGVLVTNFSMGSINRCILSVGLNVSTQNLFSLNSAIDLFNQKHGKFLPYLSPEYILATTLSCLEMLMDDLENGKLSNVLELYYKYWLHSKVEITSWKNPDDRFVIEGLDEYGFLSVTSKLNGRKSTIQPDGNSFDMLNGYIREKVEK